jgi:4-hydroxybenzoate polyprenyltransferase
MLLPFFLGGFEVALLFHFISYFITEFHRDPFLLQFSPLFFSTAHAVYGRDRLEDYLIDTKDEYIEKNYVSMDTAVNLSTIFACAYLTYLQEYAMVPIFLLLVYKYRDLKQLLPLLKPLLVASAFVTIAGVIPCHVMDHNYTILQDTPAWAPAFLQMLASTNLADLNDVEEDRLVNIKTLPVITSQAFAASTSLCLSAASIAIGIGDCTPPHFLFTAQSFASTFAPASVRLVSKWFIKAPRI